jgi:hypothetical protein
MFTIKSLEVLESDHLMATRETVVAFFEGAINSDSHEGLNQTPSGEDGIGRPPGVPLSRNIISGTTSPYAVFRLRHSPARSRP